jgi:hypothetical protein
MHDPAWSRQLDAARLAAVRVDGRRRLLNGKTGTIGLSGLRGTLAVVAVLV